MSSTHEFWNHLRLEDEETYCNKLILLPLQAPCPWTFLSLAALAAQVVLFLTAMHRGKWDNAAWFSDVTDITDVLRHLPFLSFLFRPPERLKLGKSN